MKMYIKHGKPVFSYRDTFSMDMTLSPIIYAGVKKFRDVLLERNAEGKCLGVPSGLCDSYEDTDVDAALEKWIGILDKIIYSFDPYSQPDIEDYKFDIKWHNKGNTEDGNTIVETEIVNEGEWRRYHKDLEEWEEACKEGRMLLMTHWNDMWW